jgi:hypothetical protein
MASSSTVNKLTAALQAAGGAGASSAMLVAPAGAVIGFVPTEALAQMGTLDAFKFIFLQMAQLKALQKNGVTHVLAGMGELPVPPAGGASSSSSSSASAAPAVVAPALVVGPAAAPQAVLGSAMKARSAGARQPQLAAAMGSASSSASAASSMAVASSALKSARPATTSAAAPSGSTSLTFGTSK